MAAKLITVSAVSGTTPTYPLTVDSTSGVLVNDHFSDNGGDIYRVSVITDGTHMTVVDDVAPDALEGTPVVGLGAVYTPTTNMKLSQPPFNTPGWGEMLRRDARAADAYIHKKLTPGSSALISSADIGQTIDLTLTSGNAAVTEEAGGIFIQGGAGGDASGVDPGGKGGSPQVQGGNGGEGTASLASGDGGDVYLTAGLAGSDLGGGAGEPGQVLTNVGVTIDTEVSRPSASAVRRGQLWVVQGGAGVQDILYICVKDNLDAYVWKQVTLT